MNFLAERFKNTPIKKRANILMIFFILTGLFFVVASGIAIPIMNRKEGNIRSAGVSPFH